MAIFIYLSPPQHLNNNIENISPENKQNTDFHAKSSNTTTSQTTLNAYAIQYQRLYRARPHEEGPSKRYQGKVQGRLL